MRRINNQVGAFPNRPEFLAFALDPVFQSVLTLQRVCTPNTIKTANEDFVARIKEQDKRRKALRLNRLEVSNSEPLNILARTSVTTAR